MEARAILSFIERLGRLKNTPRSGWRLRGIRDCESVADHCYRVTWLTMVLADTLAMGGLAVDREKALRMAQIHEIGESLIGDIPQSAESPISRELKHRAEDAAVERLTAPLGALGEAYRGLWREAEEATTLEARLVRAADKLEMLIQAREYERVGFRCLDEFWTHAANRRHFEELPLVAEIASLLEEERGERR